MTQQIYEKYANIMRSLSNDRRDWYISGAAIVQDYMLGDNSQYARALETLGAQICVAIRNENASNISASNIIFNIYDPYNKYNFNYTAYRFVTKVMADIMGVGVDIAVESIGSNFFNNDFGMFDTADQDPPDVMRLKAYRSRLLDFSKNNQLVNFRKYEKSSIEIKFPAVGDLLNLLVGREKIYIEHWEDLGLNQILECKFCGRQFFRPYKKKTATHSTECPICDAEKKHREKSAKPIKELPYDLQSEVLTIKCDSCGCEKRIKKAPTEQVVCDDCNAPIKLPGYPVFSSKGLKSKLPAFCVASNSDNIIQKAASVLNRRTRSLELNFGLHPLYLACGFLKWKSSNDQEYLSPLLLMKIGIFQDKTKGKFYISLDKTDDEPISLNHTLQKMLSNYSRDNSVDLPPYVDGMSYFDYQLSILSSLKDYSIASDWTIENRAAIGIFNYQKLQLEKDITDNFDKYLNHPVVRRLGDFDENAPELAKPTGGSPDFLILDADSSQSKVIDAAVAGKSFILQGPPGSGKSQTITNIIAGAMSVGKTVLFVTEKASARNIIWDNLSHVYLDGEQNLADFIYNPSGMVAGKIKSKGSSKSDNEAPSKEAFKKFYNDKFATKNKTIGLKTEILSLTHVEKKISHLYDVLGKKIGNYTVSEMISVWSQYANEKDMTISGDLAASLDELQSLEDSVTTFYRFVSKFGTNYTHHPLYGYIEKNPDLPSLSKIDRAIADKTAVEKLIADLGKLTAITLSSSYANMIDDVFVIQKWARLPEFVLKLGREGGLSSTSTVRDFYSLIREKLDYANRRQELYNRAVSKRTGKSVFISKINPDDYEYDFNSLLKLFRNHDSLFSRMGREYRDLVKVLRSKLINSDIKLPYKVILPMLTDIVEYQKAYWQCCQYEEMFGQDTIEFMSLAKGWETDWTNISKLLSATLKTINNGNLMFANEIFVYLIGARNYESAVNTLNSYSEKIKSCIKDMLYNISYLSAYFDKRVVDMDNSNYKDIFSKLQEVQNHRGDLVDWTRFRIFLESIDGNLVMDSIISSLNQARITDKDTALRMLRKAYYTKLINKEIMKNDPELSMFNSSSHADLISDYQKIDIDQMYQDAVVTYNNLSVRKNEACAKYSHGSKLITNIRGISVKSIISQKWDVIKAITPCFMMSPLSVSQYLDIDNKFDLVIFDEASQIFLEDSLASIVRGSQVIISGDRQQLPPSDFFRASDFESDDGGAAYDEYVQESGRSVLDASIKSSIDEISLRWHYRSRDESLISFSNRHFYSGSLVTFPAAMQDPELRLIYHPIQNGVYLSGKQNTNREEAEEVVKLIWKEINTSERKHFTIGVVAFSVAQAHEIEDRWYDFVASLSPDQKLILQEWENMEEHKKDPILFCNLDTIQGDERDTVIISTTYGKNKDGRFNLLFLGPVRQANGSKRINVAITRARARMLVVTSMTSEMLRSQLSKSSGKCNDGAEVLCEFLKYAESYQINRGQGGGASATYFVKSICQILDECGVQYDVGVGMSSYKVDIAVKSSKNPNQYILGINTDEQGISMQSIREYARLHPQVMTKRYGWNIYHVWQLAWFLDYSLEKERLMRVIKSLE